MNSRLTELKAKKRKFGFRLDYVGINDYQFLGKLTEYLQSNVPELENYTYSMELVGQHGSDFRLYTDDEHLAQYIRDHWLRKEPVVYETFGE